MNDIAIEIIADIANTQHTSYHLHKLSKEVSSHDDRINDLEADMAVAQRDITSLQSIATNLSTMFAELNARVTALESVRSVSTLSTMSAEIEEITESINNKTKTKKERK